VNGSDVSYCCARGNSGGVGGEESRMDGSARGAGVVIFTAFEGRVRVPVQDMSAERASSELTPSVEGE